MPARLHISKYTASIIWIIALLLLFFMDTSNETGSLCIFKFIGFTSCPGCGIGHAIHYALHLNFMRSFHEHILGLPATMTILYTVFKPLFSPAKTTIYGHQTNAYDAARPAT